METIESKMNCVILGGGGHAKVVLECLELLGGIKAVAILDANPKLWGKELMGVSIRGGDDCLSLMLKEGIDSFFVGVGSVKETTIHKELYEMGLMRGLKTFNIIHPKAICSPHVEIGEGNLVCVASILNPGVRLGNNVVINTGAIVDHDCQIGDHSHIAPGAVLSGYVKVGTGAHIGVGASVRQHITIGDGAVVGAGAVVVHDVEPYTLVKGVPARST